MDVPTMRKRRARMRDRLEAAWITGTGLPDLMTGIAAIVAKNLTDDEVNHHRALLNDPKLNISHSFRILLDAFRDAGMIEDSFGMDIGVLNGKTVIALIVEAPGQIKIQVSPIQHILPAIHAHAVESGELPVEGLDEQITLIDWARRCHWQQFMIEALPNIDALKFDPNQPDYPD